MEFHKYLEILKNKKQTVISIVMVFLVLSAVLVFVQTFKYGAETKILVVQNTQAGADPYQSNKANEYVSDVLADVILTNSFFNEMLNAGFSINRAYFPEDLNKQLKEWKKTVKTGSSNRGIITINVFHKDRDQADQIIRAINATLKAKHTLYHGSGEQVSVRVIDQPFVSNYPVKPNVVLNLVFGLVFGFIFALTYVYLFPESKYDLRLLPVKIKVKNIDDSEADDGDSGLALSGVDKSVSYDVREAINKLRQREKQEGQAYAVSHNRPVNNNAPSNIPYVASSDVPNNFSNRNQIKDAVRVDNDELDFDDISRQGSMDNVF